MIRRLDPLADRETARALLALQHAAYRVEAALIGSDAIPALSETEDDLLAAEEVLLGDPQLGFVAYRRTGATVDVHKLVVHPLFHRRGIATRLLDALDAREADAQRCTVATAAANAPALALYERRGFRRSGERLVADGLRIVELERVQLTAR